MVVCLCGHTDIEHRNCTDECGSYSWVGVHCQCEKYVANVAQKGQTPIFICHATTKSRVHGMWWTASAPSLEEARQKFIAHAEKVLAPGYEIMIYESVTL